MDSKQLFRFYNSKFDLSNWLDEKGQLAQSEDSIKWFNYGINEDFEPKIINDILKNFFLEDGVYLCISVKDSSLVQKSTAADEIGKILHKKELAIMDKSFTKIMFCSS